MAKRIQRQRTKGWRMPAGAVYVGRPTRWGNPWRLEWGYQRGMISDDFGHILVVSDCIEAHELVVGYYRNWLTNGAYPCGLHLYDKGHLDGRRNTVLTTLHRIRGHDLACWCAPEFACHADVLLELANQEVRA